MHQALPQLPLHVELSDGTPVLLRLGTPDDRETLVAGFARLSPESRVSRFFTAMPRLSPLFLDRLTAVDTDRHVAIAAQDLSRASDVDDRTGGLGIGVARYIVSVDDPTRAEMAVAVIDEYHGRGIGRALLDALLAHALDHGVNTFTATVLASNKAMLHMLAELGATIQRSPDDPSVVELEVPVTRDRVDRSRLHTMLGRAASQALVGPPEANRV